MPLQNGRKRWSFFNLISGGGSKNMRKIMVIWNVLKLCLFIKTSLSEEKGKPQNERKCIQHMKFKPRNNRKILNPGKSIK